MNGCMRSERGGGEGEWEREGETEGKGLAVFRAVRASYERTLKN